MVSQAIFPSYFTETDRRKNKYLGDGRCRDVFAIMIKIKWLRNISDPR